MLSDRAWAGTESPTCAVAALDVRTWTINPVERKLFSGHKTLKQDASPPTQCFDDVHGAALAATMAVPNGLDKPRLRAFTASLMMITRHSHYRHHHCHSHGEWPVGGVSAI